jgi:hypothetical protein
MSQCLRKHCMKCLYHNRPHLETISLPTTAHLQYDVQGEDKT